MAAPIDHVVIVGGGTAGWMTAAATAHVLANGRRRITLVESDDIGTIGVGEATIPPIRAFNARIGVDEAGFVAATGATFKLGIEFRGWGDRDGRYLHPFGDPGHDFSGVPFHQVWLKHRHRPDVGPLQRYWMSAVAADDARFDRPRADPSLPISQLNYAYHFDAGLYAAHLRRVAEAGGIRRVEGRVAAVDQHGENGHVTYLRLADGRLIDGDLFIDCSGFRSLLLGGTMAVPFQDWSHWLPCDRAVTVPSARRDPLLPVTRSTARTAGWQWRIPLQHRTGNGLVYSSAHLDEDAAAGMLMAGLDGPALGDPRPLSFRTGRRARFWHRNVVAIGLSAGFLEPLESTSIHLVQSGIQKLLALFPDRGFAPVEVDEYNRLMTAQFDAVRDFVILHYKANGRVGEPFWDALRTMAVPDSLASRINLFREKGRLFRYDDDLFSVASWVAVLTGQGIWPRGHDPLVDSLDDQRVLAALAGLADAYSRTAAAMPAHDRFVDYLRASAPALDTRAAS
nr:tryptophan 7-halogenase [Sphingomonas jejuensis]